MNNSTDKEEDYIDMPPLCSDTEDEDEDYSDMPALGIATQEDILRAVELCPDKVKLYKKPFWDKKYDEVLNLFFRTFSYDENEIEDLINDMKITEFLQIKEFIYYLIEILITMNDFCGMEFDSMDIVLNCKYANILKFSSSEHDKVRYNFISKIERKKSSEILYTEENAAFVSDDEKNDEMPELEPI
jgi:hypothetical protein